MNILAVDTAGKTAGVALLQDDRLLYEVYLDGGMPHSATLMPRIGSCLKMCGLACAGVPGVSPGSAGRCPHRRGYGALCTGRPPCTGVQCCI